VENKILEQALVDMLNKVTAGVEKGVDFLSAELPDVINQLLMWKMTESLFYTVVGVVSSILIYPLVKTAYKRFVRDCETDFAVGMISSFATFPLFIIAIETINLTWLQILIAPKIYLIEYASQLLK